MFTHSHLMSVLFLGASLCVTLLPTSDAHARRGMAVGEPFVSVGVKGALGGATLVSGNDDDNDTSRDLFIAYSVGGQARFALHPLAVFQPELGFSSRGIKRSSGEFSTSIDLQYLHMPLLLGLTYTTGLPSELSPRLFIGPYVSYLLSGSVSGKSPLGEASQDIEPGKDLSEFDAGIVVGLGVDFDLGAFILTSDIRVERGLLGLSTSDRVDYSDDTFNQVFSLNVGALFVF